MVQGGVGRRGCGAAPAVHVRRTWVTRRRARCAPRPLCTDPGRGSPGAALPPRAVPPTDPPSSGPVSGIPAAYTARRMDAHQSRAAVAASRHLFAGPSSFGARGGGSGHRGAGPWRAGSPPGGSTGGPARGGRAIRIGATGLLAAVVVGVLLLLTLGGSLVDLVTDGMWYQSVGYAEVLWTRLGAQVALFVGVGAVVLAVLLADLWVAARLAPPPPPGGGTLRHLWDRLNEASRYETRSTRVFGPFGPSEPIVVGGEATEPPDLTPLLSWTLIGIAILGAVTAAGVAAGSWETVLLWLHRVPYSPTGQTVPDPVFGLDISFFLFDLPFLRLVQGLASGVLLAALVIAAARHLAAMARGSFVPSRAARVHLAVLAALWLLTAAAGYQLDRLNLTHSTQGVATGVSYADQAARFFAFDALTVVAIVVAVVLVLSAFQRRWWPIAGAVGTWLALWVVLAGLYPQVVESFVVKPNELAVEQPYITNNIRMTRLAYGLDQWQEQPYQGAGELTQAAIAADQSTFANARLWDYRPLTSTLDQLQTVRQYYDFVDVDADRYQINGQQRQVWISAREIAPENNPSAQTWVNQHITYTHGIGAVMAPVNEVTNEGLPQLLISNIPPVSTGGAPTITQPRIYFGEKQNGWVVVDAASQEFDYPVTTGASGSSSTGGANQAYTTWHGQTGIGIGSPAARLLFALRFRDLNLLISDQVTARSQLLFRRALADRLPLIAPFLRFDKDPYLVITDQGRLAYVQDAYTTSADFPNAQAIDPSTLPAGSGLQGDPFDYVRNSVKIVMDAYDGTTTMYVADAADPIIRAWEGVFPGIFRPQGQMPAWLKAHLRYPEDFFDAQARMYATYHVTDPATFYYQNDLWTVPQESTSTQQLPLEAYYVEMRMPGAPAPEFLLLQPMVPTSRPNMSAWIAARMDAPNYGKVVVYAFPKDTSIQGPAQIEGRIDQDPTISSQITLWNQSGSTVVRGNLIVVPIQQSLLYLEPIYLQSTSIQFPEFQRIVVASPTKVAWGATLSDALNALLAASPATGAGTGSGAGSGGGPGSSPGPAAAPAGSAPAASGPLPTPPSGDVRTLVAYANAHFEAAQAALRAGDFARYGQEMNLVQAALAQLSILTGQTPSPSPAAP